MAMVATSAVGGERARRWRRLPRRAVVIALLLVAQAASPAGAAPGQWKATGTMNVARQDHAAVGLPSGQVLVVGGDSSTTSTPSALNSAELYRPDLKSWSFTGVLATARHRHTATLLSDGRVLVVGGRNSGGPLASAEVYDPSAGTWASAGTLTTGPRFWHTATLLSDGRVLIAAGLSGRNVGNPGFCFCGELIELQTAEIWDPDTGLFTATGPLNVKRDSHTATLLSDGRVLVAGGFDHKTAEIYDPAQGTWSLTGEMMTERMNHSATLLAKGTVLVAGGRPGSGSAVDSAEIFDPATGTWSATSSMAEARSSHSATLLTSDACSVTPRPTWCRKVLVGGGFGPGAAATTSEMYDRKTGTWTSVGSLGIPRAGHTATLFSKGGKVLVAGGQGGPLASAEIFAPPV